MTQKNDTWLVLGLALVIGMVAAGPARGGPSPEEIGARLAELGLEVEARIEIARYNHQRGSVDRDQLDRWATGAERSLEILERRARLLDAAGTEVLARKVDAVRMSVENLRRASELGTAPPRISHPGGPVRHLERGRDRRHVELGGDHALSDTAWGIRRWMTQGLQFERDDPDVKNRRDGATFRLVALMGSAAAH